MTYPIAKSLYDILNERDFEARKVKINAIKNTQESVARTTSYDPLTLFKSLVLDNDWFYRLSDFELLQLN